MRVEESIHATREDDSKAQAEGGRGEGLLAMRLGLGFDIDMADPTDDVIVGRLAFLNWNNVDAMMGILGAQNELLAEKFNVLDSAGVVFTDSVHGDFVLAIRS